VRHAPGPQSFCRSDQIGAFCPLTGSGLEEVEEVKEADEVGEKKEQLGLSPALRHAVKRLFAARCISIVPTASCVASCAPAGEAEAGSAGAHPAKE
jgi:hypothetical protein